MPSTLPFDIIINIIEQAVKHLRPSESLGLRLVCKSFDKEVIWFGYGHGLIPFPYSSRASLDVKSHYLTELVHCRKVKNSFVQYLESLTKLCLTFMVSCTEDVESQCRRVVCDTVLINVEHRHIELALKNVCQLMIPYELPSHIPIQIAAALGLDKHVREALASGVDPARSDRIFGQPLKAAAFQDQFEIVDLLLQHAGDTQDPASNSICDNKPMGFLEASIPKKMPALSCASARGNVQTLHSLLYSSKDYSSRGSFRCKAATLQAIIYRQTTSFRFLLPWICLCRTFNSDTLCTCLIWTLMQAAEHGSTDILQILLQMVGPHNMSICKVRHCRPCQYGDSAIWSAAFAKQRSSINLVASFGFRPKLQWFAGYLMDYKKKDNPNVLTLLQEYRAELEENLLDKLQRYMIKNKTSRVDDILKECPLINPRILRHIETFARTSNTPRYSNLVQSQKSE